MAKGVLLFGALGPPVGSYVLLLLWALSSLGDAWSWGMVKDVAVLLIVFPVFSYVLGLIPAVVVGALVGWWRPTLNRRWGIWAVMALSAGVGAAFFVLLFSNNFDPTLMSAVVLASAVAGAVCG